MLPTGGVNAATAGEYIAAGASALGVGSELVDPAALAAGEDHVLTERAKELVSGGEGGESEADQLAPPPEGERSRGRARIRVRVRARARVRARCPCPGSGFRRADLVWRELRGIWMPVAAPDKRVSMAQSQSQRSSTAWVCSAGARAKTWTASTAAAASAASPRAQRKRDSRSCPCRPEASAMPR